MDKNNRMKIAAAVVVMTIINIAVIYGYQCLTCMLVEDRAQAQTGAVLLLMSGGPVMLSQLVFLLIAKGLKWLETTEICQVVMICMILYIALMFLMFPHIPVPYALVPSGEMAFGFIQLLTEVFSSVGALVCILISVIILLDRKKRSAG